MYNILFVCIHNSARSQMAEAFLNQLRNGQFRAESAGIEKGKLNPYVIRAMHEVGVDLSNNKTKEVLDVLKQGRTYHAVITVCEKEAAERCPVVPGIIKKIAWSFPDPSKFTGTEEEILSQVRMVRDEIKKKVIQFIAEAGETSFWIDARNIKSSEN
jgi:arsenate reductase